MSPRELLGRWLRPRLDADARAWLDRSEELLAGGAGERDVYLAISLVSRRLGRADLELDERALAEAEESRAGWDPRGLSTDQAGRLLLVLAMADGDQSAFHQRLEVLCNTADVAELIAFYRGLPLYPDPDALAARAAEGVRSNVTPVFEAVAHRNPYPAERFDERAWNHMVLKALFVESALDPIVGLDDRANPALARMLRDYAHERWAAGRTISPELWRCVAPHADDDALADLERALAAGDRGADGAALALADSPHPDANAILARHPERAAAVGAGDITWSGLAPARG